MKKKSGTHKMPGGEEMTGDTHSKSSKPVKKSKGKKTAWMVHLDKVYREAKKKDSNYKYSQAMKDAKKSYKK